MTQKYINKEVKRQDSVSNGQACILEDMRTDHMVIQLFFSNIIYITVERAGDESEAADLGRAQEALRPGAH